MLTAVVEQPGKQDDVVLIPVFLDLSVRAHSKYQQGKLFDRLSNQASELLSVQRSLGHQLPVPLWRGDVRCQLLRDDQCVESASLFLEQTVLQG